MKHIANVLTVTRIILATVLLIFFREISVLFLIIFTIAQFTDIIDGTIARKTGSCSKLGALLDSIADLLLASNLIKILFTMKIITKRNAIWLFIVLLIGTISPIINFIKHKKLFFIHSIPCKIFGSIILVMPYAVYFGFVEQFLTFALCLLTFDMIEIVIMSILLKEPDPNAKSIHSIIKQNYTIKT